MLTGIGRKILAEKAALAVGFGEIVDLADIWGEGAATMTPAFGMASLATEVIEGGRRY